MSLSRAIVVAALLAHSLQAAAITRTWPGPAPCNGTLQACITAASPLDVINIASNGPIAENAVFNKSLTVQAAPGFKPVFATGHFLFASLTGPGGFEVAFSGLTLNNGYVQLIRGGTGNADFRVENMTLNSSSNSANTRIRIDGNNTGTLAVRVAGNRIQAGSDTIDAPSIDIRSRGPTATAVVAFNRIEATGNPVGNGIRAFSEVGGSLELDVFANEVRGYLPSGAMRFRTLNAPMDLRLINNLVVGTRSLGSSGNFDGVAALAGSSTLDALVYNNTIVDTGGGLVFGNDGGSADVTGAVENNLVAFNNFGLYFNAGSTGMSNARNGVFGNSSNVFTPGTGTVTADPQLVALRQPRLRTGSPAINAGNAISVQVGIVLGDQPQVDLDGLRRTVGVGAQAVDIGAYESGDGHVLARKHGAEASGFFLIDHASLNGQTTVRAQLTKNFSPPGYPVHNNPLAVGLWYTGGFWSPFTQSQATMTQGSAFNVFVPGPQAGFGTAYAHTAAAATITDHYTTLDQTFLNGTKDAIVLVTSNWNQPGTSVYNNHHLSVGPICIGPPAANCWAIMNQDAVAMPVNATFNVYAQDPSPNAWVHSATSNNSSGANTSLDHPLLNDIPCARPQVTRKLSALQNWPYDVYYTLDEWRISNQAGSSITGSEFFVVVDPAQVAECTDTIFANAFSG